ncbi:hypothetical protein LC087_13355 [Bacillus carboniphilus]|uniref:Uncharacterized protein n=1 Tax=Bacillus carboniphilus TaxID=86663 RepID=A0ABY9JTR8_9BACI|nr:hypothetical protein [Bacillus carboniphilus]WLR41822.1 hypothetical protein LC087_13355 [Bacillus carboniphilus]
MNAVKGTYRLLYEDMRFYLILFSAITILMAAVYLFIGIFFDADYYGTLFGPLYGAICTVAIYELVVTFPIAIGLGSTRSLFIKCYFLMGFLMVFGTTFVLNSLYFIIYLLETNGFHKVGVFHPGMFYSYEPKLIPFFWIDFMVGLTLFGLSSFITMSWRRLGTVQFFIYFFIITMFITSIIAILGTNQSIEWISKFSPLEIFNTIGLFGLILILLTYPLMKNAPLKMKGAKA